MPNYCNYRMKIAGRRDNVNAMIQIIQNKCDKPHLYRIFEANLEYTQDYGLWRKAYVSGYCAWSVYCCMFPGPATYYGDDMDPERRKTYYEPDNYIIGTNIINEAKRLSLTIEIKDETGEFNEWFLGEWKTYQQMQADMGEDYKIPFDEEAFKRAKLYDGEYWLKKDFEEPDTIPDKPVRLTKDILYKVVDKNE